MKLTKIIVNAVVLLTLAAVPLQADTIYSLTAFDSILVGTVLDGVGESAVSSTQALAQAFALNQAAQITTINLEMSGFGVDKFTVWLTNAIGPSTTQANVLFQTTLTFPNTGGGSNGQTVSAPTSLFLSKGSYFLVLASNQPSIFQGLLDDGPSSILPTTTGIVGSLFFTFPSDLNVSFAPASFFSVATGTGEFQIVGTSVPESSTFLLVIVGLIIVIPVLSIYGPSADDNESASLKLK